MSPHPAAVAAAQCEDGVDLGIQEHGIQILNPLGVRSRGEPMARLDVPAGFDVVTLGLEVAHGGLEPGAASHRARGCDEADGVTASEAGRAEGVHRGACGENGVARPHMGRPQVSPGGPPGQGLAPRGDTKSERALDGWGTLS